jgi:hypothetical protein
MHLSRYLKIFPDLGDPGWFMSYLRDGDMKGVDCWKGLLEATMEKSILQDLKYRPKAMPRVHNRT